METKPLHPPASILTGDAKLLAAEIPDSSVALVFCDPIYANVEDYSWLGEVSARVLKPNGNLFCFTRVRDEADRKARVEAAGLEWRWTIPYVVLGSGLQLHQYKLFNKWQPLLWFGHTGEKPAPRRWWTDYLQAKNGSASSLPDVKAHKWSKHPDCLAQIILAMTDPEEFVLDPFAGSGSIPAVAKMFRRQALGFEIDPVIAEKARARVDATPIHEFLPNIDWAASAAAQYGIEFGDEA